MATRGRKANHPKKIGIYVKIQPSTATVIDEARWKKGLTRGEYWEQLVTIGDKQIPNVPPSLQKQLRLKFFAYPLNKNGKAAMA